MISKAGEESRTVAASPETLWYKEQSFTNFMCATFCDSNGDGIGDFPGLMQELDYLQELGVNAIWLLPFFPSPLRDDGYDISDYTAVHPSYGRLEDFKAFLASSSRQRDAGSYIELVLNHTSDQHSWFQESRSSRDNPKRDWYVWRESDDHYQGVRIIFPGHRKSRNWAWDPLSKSYYWHRLLQPSA